MQYDCTSVDEAFTRLKDVLGRYPRPTTQACGCDACAEESEVLAAAGAMPYSRLTDRDVAPAFWKAYTTWCCTWDELAYFVPRALEIIRGVGPASCGGLSLDEEMVYWKLLVSARPELENSFAPPESAPNGDQAAIACAVSALGLEFAAEEPSGYSDDLMSAVSFLAAYSQPMDTFLLAWASHPHPATRARYACFISSLLTAGESKQPVFHNTYGPGRLEPWDGNRSVLDAISRPAIVAAYILQETEAVEMLPDDEKTMVTWAYGIAAERMGNI